MSREVPSGVHSPCAHCRWRALAEEHPTALLARIWRWHTRWCPGWKDYQRQLAALGDKSENGAGPSGPA